MWMTHNGGTEKLRFLVLPDLVNIRKANSSKSVNIQGLGEVIIKDDPEAIIVSFSSFFPAAPFPGIQVEPDEFVTPNRLKDIITVWQKSDKPVHWFVTGMTTGLHFRIEDFPYFERGGDVGTLHYTLVLKEYRTVKIRSVELKQEKAVVPAPAPARVDNRVAPRTHTVVKGDNLWKIARTYYGGTGSDWNKIYDANKDKIKNPNLIYPGQVFTIP